MNDKHSKVVWGVASIVSGIIGTLALSDIGPHLAHPIRIFLGVVFLCIAFLYLFPYIYYFLIIRLLDIIINNSVQIYNKFSRKYPESHLLRLLFDSEYNNRTVYAATAFVYKSGKNPIEFLWLKEHATHSDLLPPGGRLIANALPHDAIITIVSSETGILERIYSFQNCSIMSILIM
jgi:hypothetical protein